MYKKAVIASIALILALAVCAPGFAQEQKSSETESFVPELDSFHEIIYPIWHDAYPNKDIAALRGFVPQIETLAGKIYSAKLPGILRDKEAKWTAGVAELRKSVEAYKAAAAGTDDQALLDAAETLHMKYEMLVRSIRPVLKEVDEFHKVLYVIFHKYLPDKKYGEIKAVAADLKLKAEAVTKTTLSKRLESKAEAYRTAAGKLLEAAQKLEEACAAGVGEAIEKAVDLVHTRYQALEIVFD